MLESAFGRIGVDISDHLEFGFAEASDQLAGLIPRRLAITRRLDQPAASLRFVAQRGETLLASIRQFARWRRRESFAGAPDDTDGAVPGTGGKGDRSAGADCSLGNGAGNAL